MNKSSEHKPLTNILISTCFGHGGMGMFPYIFYPPFWILLFTAWLTNTAIIAKSATRYRHHGNYIWWNLFTYKFIHRIKDLQSILNSYGLTNPGVWVCAIMIKMLGRWDLMSSPASLLISQRVTRQDTKKRWKPCLYFEGCWGKNSASSN